MRKWIFVLVGLNLLVLIAYFPRFLISRRPVPQSSLQAKTLEPLNLNSQLKNKRLQKLDGQARMGKLQRLTPTEFDFTVAIFQRHSGYKQQDARKSTDYERLSKWGRMDCLNIWVRVKEFTPEQKQTLITLAVQNFRLIDKEQRLGKQVEVPEAADKQYFTKLLERFGDKSAIPHLLPLLKHPDSRLTNQVRKSLKALGHPVPEENRATANTR